MNNDSILKFISLKEAVEFVVDNRGKTAPTSNSGIPLIATNCISNADLYPVFKNIRFVSKDTFDTWFRAHPSPGDIILTLKGSQNGAVCLVPSPVNFAIAQDMVALRADESVINSLYLFAALRSEEIQTQIKNLDVSGIIPHFKKTDFDKLMIPLPSPKLQKYIGNLYYKLSKKIELNNQINETLESISKAIFNEWFIDFGPVKAKAEGKMPFGMDDATAALFPDSFEESELGMNPKGWNISTLYDLANWQNGMAFKPNNFSNTGLPIIKIAELKSGIDSGTKRTDQDHEEKFKIKDSEILFSWSGSPDTSIDTFIWDKGDAWLNQHIFKVTPKEVGKSFIYSLLKHLKPVLIETARNKQTTGLGHVTVADLKRLKTVLPNTKTLNAFEKLVEPLLSKYFLNLKENQSLLKTRDLLLPKLISGEINPKDLQ